MAVLMNTWVYRTRVVTTVWGPLLAVLQNTEHEFMKADLYAFCIVVLKHLDLLGISFAKNKHFSQIILVSESVLNQMIYIDI